MRCAAATTLLLVLWAVPAQADLYRWIDPETGSVKFSSYPPPWYGDPAKQRRAPRVERIPQGRESPARPGTEEPPVEESRASAASPPAQAGRIPQEMEARRKALLLQTPAMAAQGGDAFVKHVEALATLSDQIDKLDPAGAVARQTEAMALIEKFGKAPR